MVNYVDGAQNEQLTVLALVVFVALLGAYWCCRWLCCSGDAAAAPRPSPANQVTHGFDEEEEEFRRSLEMKASTTEAAPPPPRPVAIERSQLHVAGEQDALDDL